jgi:competence protein ComEC
MTGWDSAHYVIMDILSRMRGAVSSADGFDESRDVSHLLGGRFLPAALFLAVSLWIAAAVSLSCMQVMSIRACLLVAAASCLGSIACAVAVLKSNGSRIALVLLGVAAGCAVSGAAAASLHDACRQAEDAGSAEYLFQIVEDPQAGDFGISCIAETVLDNGLRVRARVNLPEGSDLLCWESFSARCRLKPPNDSAASYYWQKECVGSATVHSIARVEDADAFHLLTDFRRKGIALFSNMHTDGAALMRALVFSDRNALLESPLYSEVKATGLAHAVAVSGSHLAVVASFLALLLRLLKTPRSVAVPIEAVFMTGYVLFTGAPHSAIRSAIMATCAIMSFFARRRSFATNALSVCIIGLLAINPHLALSVSLALSSGATLGIILFSRYLGAWLEALMGGHCRFLSEAFGMTLAASLLTMPISVSLFGQLSLVAPLANLLTSPIFAFLCVGGMLASVLCSLVPLFAGLLPDSLISAAQVLCDLIEWCASLPYACIPAQGNMVVLGLVAAGVCMVLWILRPRPHASAAWAMLGCGLALFIGSMFFLPGLHGDEIVMLDVGQGDAFLIRSGSHAVLIDTGNSDSAVLAGLARHDVRHLDAVVITHPDDDHCGSLESILDTVETDRVCVAADLLESTSSNCVRVRSTIEGQNVIGLHKGDRIEWADFDAVVLSPDHFADDGGNADSIVLKVGADCNGDGASDWNALFCGDAESNVLDGLAKSGDIGAVDIYKVGHHGSKAAVNDNVLSALEPSISLVSVGAGNRYGHPAAATLEALQAHSSKVFRTDQSGDVVCSLRQDGIVVDGVG